MTGLRVAMQSFEAAVEACCARVRAGADMAVEQIGGAEIITPGVIEGGERPVEVVVSVCVRRKGWAERIEPDPAFELPTVQDYEQATVKMRRLGQLYTRMTELEHQLEEQLGAGESEDGPWYGVV